MSSPKDTTKRSRWQLNASPPARASYLIPTARRRQLSSGPLGSTNTGIRQLMQFYRTFQLLLICLTIGFLNGCKKQNNDPISPAPTMNSIWPLTVGNVWSYLETAYDSSGSVIDRGDLANSIRSDTLINGQRWFRPNFYLFNGEVFLRNNSTGLWLFNLTNRDSSLWLKYPALAGDNYSITNLSNEPQNCTVLSTNDTVAITLGAYSCYHYKMVYKLNQDSIIAHEFFAPNIGEIKSQLFTKKNNGSPYQSSTLVLETFLLN